MLLDSGPVGLLARARSTRSPARECNEWAASMLQAGHRLIVPESIDFEVRRELVRLGNQRALLRLNPLPIRLGFHDVSSQVLRQAAHFWVEARRRGKPTADRHSLDIDMILAGHAATIGEHHSREQVLIATTNVQHLRMFADAREWSSITQITSQRSTQRYDAVLHVAAKNGLARWL